MPSAAPPFARVLWLLVAIQAAAALGAAGAALQARRLERREAQLAAQRGALDAFAAQVHELYVHQAHTFIEGGPDHLDHYGEAGEAARVGGAALGALPAPGAAGMEIQAAREDLTLFEEHFASEVAPRARAGALDRDTASVLHRRAEELVAHVDFHLRRAGEVLSAEQAEARRQATVAANASWWLAVGLTFTAAAASLLAARRIAAMNTQIAEATEARVRAERLAALGEMSAAVAHELNNPIAVLLADPELRRPELAPARAEVEHARRVVQGLLGFARPGTEAPEELDLLEVARAAVERAGPYADLREVRLRCGGGERRLRIPPSAARQILDNLLRNAVQASPEGGEVEVEIHADALIVRDRGPGLPPAVRQKLYEPFSTGRAEGVGLGLAVCQRIARAWGGQLRHLDRDGGGTEARWEFGPRGERAG